MDCPSCHEQTNEPLTCAQCGSTFCASCQPYWDYTSEVCQGCQEFNTVAALKDDAWTARMRRWFTKKLPAPVEPQLAYKLPWRVEHNGDGWCVVSPSGMVASFVGESEANYTCLAANSHYQLSGLAVMIHNRIRAGDPWFDGSERDCELWRKVKSALENSAPLHS